MARRMFGSTGGEIQTAKADLDAQIAAQSLLIEQQNLANQSAAQASKDKMIKYGMIGVGILALLKVMKK